MDIQNLNERTGAQNAPFLLDMFEVGDIVSVITEMIDGYPHGRNGVGGLFPVNRKYYEVVADLGNGLYIIGIGNLAIAAVTSNGIQLEDVSSAWQATDISGVVKIRNGARNYMGYPLPNYVYGREFTVVGIMCDRVSLRSGDHTVAVKAEDLL